MEILDAWIGSGLLINKIFIGIILSIQESTQVGSFFVFIRLFERKGVLCKKKVLLSNSKIVVRKL